MTIADSQLDAEVDQVDLSAYTESVRRDLGEVVGTLRDVLGARLVAYLGSVRETRAVREWIEGRRPSSDVVRRLRMAYRVLVLIREFEGTQIVATWFQGMNPILDDRSPAAVLRDADWERDVPRVLGAARAFVTN